MVRTVSPPLALTETDDGPNPSKQSWNVCRLHGAGGGAPSGSAHPNYRHGLRTKEMQELRRLVSLLGKKA